MIRFLPAVLLLAVVSSFAANDMTTVSKHASYRVIRPIPPTNEAPMERIKIHRPA